MSEKYSVLVVDDEENIRIILAYTLRLNGFEVYLAKDGPTGLELAREKKPDVIVLDWMMPEMDGLEVLSELENDEGTKDIPVIMFTAKGKMLDVGQALYQGAADYILKPFEPDELAEVIRRKIESMVKN